MAANELKLNQDASAPTEFPTLTNLHSLAATNIWISEQITPGNPSPTLVRISYDLHCNASVAADEQIVFRLIRGDNHGSEIRTAGVSTSEQEVSTASTKEDIRDAAEFLHAHRIRAADQDVKGEFDIVLPGPDWQLAVELDSASGALDASGNSIRYLNGQMQKQTS